MRERSRSLLLWPAAVLTVDDNFIRLFRVPALIGVGVGAGSGI